MVEDKSPQLGDSRIAKRARAALGVTFEINESMKKQVRLSKDIVQTTSSDISSGGIAIISDYFIPRGTLLDIKIDKVPLYPGTSKEGDFIQVTGKVVSSVMEKANRYRLGIQFTRIDDKEKKAIEKFVEGYEKNI